MMLSFQPQRQITYIRKCAHSDDSDQPALSHYENTPIQIYWTFTIKKTWKFSDNILIFFHISAQNIDCGYSLEQPRRGGSNEYQQFVFEKK